MHAYNPSTWEAEAGALGVPGQSLLHSKFEDSLGYMKPQLKTPIQKYCFPDFLSSDLYCC